MAREWMPRLKEQATKELHKLVPELEKLGCKGEYVSFVSRILHRKAERKCVTAGVVFQHHESEAEAWDKLVQDFKTKLMYSLDPAKKVVFVVERDFVPFEQVSERGDEGLIVSCVMGLVMLPGHTDSPGAQFMAEWYEV